MERLQHALEIARTKRKDASSTAPAARPHTPRPAPAATSVDEAWAQLAPVELDPEALIRNRIVSKSSDPAAVPFDILRTKVQLMMQKNGWKRLAITSPSPGCGKTTLACNLASGFARQNEVRTIVFEFDMRRPSMTGLLGLPRNGSTMEDMLRGTSEFSDHAVRLKETVAIAVARRAASDPGNLVVSQQTLARIAEIEAAYAPDFLIFDLPPVLSNEDTRAFLRNVDGALIVAAAGSSTVKEIDICEREVAEHTNVMGVVLNQCRFGDETARYSYGDNGGAA